jgi:hypothetical protein
MRFFSLLMGLSIFTFADENLCADGTQFLRYVDYHEIFPAQFRYASRNVEDKIEKAVQRGYASQNSEGGWTYEFFEGRSIIPEKEALPVVRASFGYVLVDGHHEVLSSIALGADWIPIKIIADLGALTPERFWKEAEERGWAYLIDLHGIKHPEPPATFDQLIDDSNRYFAAISARKYAADLSSSIGAEYPLWIKIGKDTPFIEFKISDVLWRHQIIYDYEIGDRPPEELIEAARAALLAADVPGLKLVPSRQHYTQIEMK